MLRSAIPLLLVTAVLAGCAGGLLSRDDAPQAPEVPVSVTLAPGEDVLRPEARPNGTAENGDLASVERAPREGIAGRGGLLGETLAGLGSPSEGGLWVRTGLVSSVQPGRVESEGGATVEVELRPSGREPGAGSQISLEALRTLDLPLTQLATLRVYAGR
ncbi:MAG: D-galactarate dehydratase [Pararhodobacter sp.]|nr:D-galactarate dehydratase [Pararhodobacter sp.]